VITSLEDGHVNRPCGVLRHRHNSVKLLFAYTHCPSRSSDSAQGKCCRNHHEGTGHVYSLTQALASFLLKQQGPLLTPKAQFSPGSPSHMQEPLANQPEQSYEIWCKTCTITASVCKHLLSPPVGGRAHPCKVSLGKTFLCRDTGLFEGVHFPFLLLVCITSQVEKLCPTRMELCWLSPLFSARGVSGIARQLGLSTGCILT